MIQILIHKKYKLRRVAAVLAIFLLTLSAAPAAAAADGHGKELLLCPGGMPFGVRFATDGVLIVGIPDNTSPAARAGLRVGDVILKIDGKPAGGAAAVGRAIDGCGGRAVRLDCLRDGRELTVTLTPRKTQGGGFEAGVMIRDGGAGIGTVTYIDPTCNIFGGLGHGICDPDTGRPMPMSRGCLLGVRLTGIERSRPGAPGELRGSFDSVRLGAVTENTALGVFGAFATLPSGTREAIPIAHRAEVREGDAVMLCTLDGGGVGEYSIRLAAIDRTSRGGRSFTVQVTDSRLIERTGGILQGMSGSPIIQDGRLVGAVTHVMISDPTTGYGIFIENMLAANK